MGSFKSPLAKRPFGGLPAARGVMQEAIFSGNEEKVRLLLGEDPSSSTRVEADGNSPLHLAASSQQLAICKALLGSKADPLALDKDNNTPLHRLVLASEAAASCSERSELLREPVAYGAPINALNNDGKAPIHLAASKGFTNTALVLSNSEGFVVDVPDS